MTTKINRTPFRPIKDIPSALLALDIHWQTGFSDRACVLTSDGKHGHYLRDDGTMSSIHWMDMRDTYVVRPLNRTWEEVEALATPKPEPKAEEPFRPGLPPARLRAVCPEWEWAPKQCQLGCVYRVCQGRSADT